VSISRMIYINDLKPEELADGFCELDSHQQAEFFNRVAAVMNLWAPGSKNAQIYEMSKESILSNDAKALMELIGEYAKC